MRKLLTLLLLVPSLSFAQGFYIKPELSIGFGNIKASSTLNPKNTTAYKAGIGVGFELNGFRLETGLAYFQTGYKFTDLNLFFEGQFEPVTGNVTDYIESMHYHFQTILMPVKAGYVFDVAKVRIVPEIGAAKLFIMDADAVDIYGKTHKEVKKSLLEDYEDSNILITAGVHVEIPVYKRMSVTAGPSFYYYLNPQPRSSWKQYAGLFDAGVVYKF